MAVDRSISIRGIVKDGSLQFLRETLHQIEGADILITVTVIHEPKISNKEVKQKDSERTEEEHE